MNKLLISLLALIAAAGLFGLTMTTIVVYAGSELWAKGLVAVIWVVVYYTGHWLIGDRHEDTNHPRNISGRNTRTR